MKKKDTILISTLSIIVIGLAVTIFASLNNPSRVSAETAATVSEMTETEIPKETEPLRATTAETTTTPEITTIPETTTLEVTTTPEIAKTKATTTTEITTTAEITTTPEATTTTTPVETQATVATTVQVAITTTTVAPNMPDGAQGTNEDGYYYKWDGTTLYLWENSPLGWKWYEYENGVTAGTVIEVYIDERFIGYKFL